MGSTYTNNVVNSSINQMKQRFLFAKQEFLGWFMRQSVNLRIVIIMIGALILWMISGFILRFTTPEDTTLRPIPQPTVRIQTFSTSTIQPKVTLYGVTESYKKIMLSSEVPGKVIKIFEREGSNLKKDTPILQLDPQGFQSRYEEAKAALKAKKIEREATLKLHQKQLRSDANLAAAEAALDAAQAQLLQSEYELQARTIKTPFDGKLNKLYIKVGSIIDKEPFGEMLGDGVFLVVAHIAEKDVSHIYVGNKAHVRLVNGTILDGHVRYISDSANAATRTYRVEVEVPNDCSNLRDGMSAEVAIFLPEIPAIHLPSSLFVLDDEGRIGVRGINDENKVVFYQTTLLDEDEKGFWVSGIPDKAMLITTGQGFVRKGVEVLTQPETLVIEGTKDATQDH